MKLKPVTVAIRRGKNGYLNAYVVMAPFTGSNLLEGREIEQLENARMIAAQVLAVDNIEVEKWIDEASDPPPSVPSENRRK